MATIDDVQVKDVIFYNDRMYHLIGLDDCSFCCFCHHDFDGDMVCFLPEDFPSFCPESKIFERIYL